MRSSRVSSRTRPEAWRATFAGRSARLARERRLERVLVVEVELGDGVVREVGVVLLDHADVVLAQARQLLAHRRVALEHPLAELVQRQVLPALDQREHLEHYAASLES